MARENAQQRIREMNAEAKGRATVENQHRAMQNAAALGQKARAQSEIAGFGDLATKDAQRSDAEKLIAATQAEIKAVEAENAEIDKANQRRAALATRGTIEVAKILEQMRKQKEADQLKRDITKQTLEAKAAENKAKAS
jgi:hypothetical protein